MFSFPIATSQHTTLEKKLAKSTLLKLIDWTGKTENLPSLVYAGLKVKIDNLFLTIVTEVSNTNLIVFAQR